MTPEPPPTNRSPDPAEPRMSSNLLAALRDLLAASRAGATDAEPSLLADLESLAGRRLDAEDVAAWLEGTSRAKSDAEPETTAATIGAFRLERELGRGGQGSVWLATDTRIGRTVALKILPRVGDASALERLRREALLAARVDDPGVSTVYEFGLADGAPFLAMRYVEGETLSDRLRAARDESAPVVPESASDEPDPARRIVRTFARIARSLHVAHEAGLVHRDIKPSNLVLATDGRPVILDFGLARAADSDSSLTATREPVGTPAYMSPEQIRGASAVDRRTDVWSLGATLHECLALRRPFDAPTREALYRSILEDEAPRLDSTETSASADLATVVATALARDADRRYATAADFALDLERVLDGAPIGARRTTDLERAVRWMGRHRTATTLAVGFVLALLGGLLASLVLLRRVDEERKTAIDAVAAKDRALRQAFLDRARAGVHSGRAGARWDGLDALRQAAAIAPGIDLRSAAVACLVRDDLRAPPDSQRDPETTRLVACDEAGTTWAIARTDGSISVERPGSPSVSLRGDGTPPEFLSVSPGGTYVATTRGNVVLLHDAATTEPILQRPTMAYGFDVSPDDTRFAVASPAGSVVVVEPRSGEELWSESGTRAPYALRFSRDGSRLAISSRDENRVDVFDTFGSDPHASLSMPTPRGVSWSSDDRLLAVACTDQAIRVFDLHALDAPPVVLAGHHLTVTYLAFLDEDRLVSNSWDGALTLWSVRRRTPLVATIEQARPLSAHADGTLVVLADVDSGQFAWEVARPVGFADFHVADESVYASPVTSRDGRWVVARGRDRVRVFDRATGRTAGTLPLVARHLAFQPDGSALIVSTDGALERWPWRDDGERTTIGPGSPVRALAGEGGEFAIDRHGRVLLKEGRDQATVFSLAAPDDIVTLPHDGLTYVALSDDGRWATTSRHGGGAVRIWNARTGQLVTSLPARARAHVKFSRDGEHMVVFAIDRRPSRYEVFRTSTWERTRTIECRPGGRSWGAMDMSADGRYLAYAPDRRTVHVTDFSTQELLVELDMPRKETCEWLEFDSTSRRLTAGGSTLVEWDIDALRVELRRSGLDWDAESPIARMPAAPRQARDLVIVDPRLPPDEAARSIDEAVAQRPDDLALRLARAQRCLAAGDLEDALVEADRILAADPDLLPALEVRAEALGWSNRLEDAIAMARHILDRTHDPERVLRWQNAIAWMGALRPGPACTAEHALELARDCLGRDATEPNHWIAGALALVRLGLVDEAAQAARIATQTRSGVAPPRALAVQALAAAHVGDAATATALLARVDAARPPEERGVLDRDLEALTSETRSALTTRASTARSRETTSLHVVSLDDDGRWSHIHDVARVPGHWNLVVAHELDETLHISLHRSYTGHSLHWTIGAPDVESAPREERLPAGFATVAIATMFGVTYRYLQDEGSGSTRLDRLRDDGSAQTIRSYRWTSGWSDAAFGTIGGGPILAHVKEGSGDLHVMRVMPGGFSPRFVDRNVRPGWSALRFVPHPDSPRLLLCRESTGETAWADLDDEGRLGEFHPGPRLPAGQLDVTVDRRTRSAFVLDRRIGRVYAVSLVDDGPPTKTIDIPGIDRGAVVPRDGSVDVVFTVRRIDRTE